MNQIFMYYLLQSKTLIMKSWLQKFFGGLQAVSQKRAQTLLPQRVFLFSFFMMVSFFSHAQNTTTVSGAVTDTSGVMIMGVTVTTDHSGKSVVTQEGGTFSIPVTAADK